MSEMQRGLMAKRWQQRQFRPAPALKRRSRLVFDAFEVLDLASKVRVNHCLGPKGHSCYGDHETLN